MFSKSPLLLSAIALLSLSACGTITGIPSHGGGKRYAIEQELVSASTRASFKDIDISALKGKKVAVFVVSMGDQGAGNLFGGRYSITGALRGDYVVTPESVTHSNYPVLDTQSTTTTSSGATTTTTIQNALNAPERSDTRQQGFQTSSGLAIGGSTPSDYRNSEFLSNDDFRFLQFLLRESLTLRGIEVVEASQADVNMLVAVDVFGTIRSREDYQLYNAESLIAKTALEVSAVDARTGSIVMKAVNTGFESEYKEKYLLWMGPIDTEKTIKRSEPLLVNFSDLQ